jgi:hypothetical protein
MKFLYIFYKLQYLFKRGLLIVFIAFAICACSSLKNIEIEIAIPPQYPIGEDVQSLALLNRSLTKGFTNNSIDSLEKILVNHRMILDTVFQDSVATDTVIQVAAKALFESQRFDVVVPKDRNIIRTDNEEIVNPLKISFINDICTDFKVDGVLVLESFVEQLKTKYNLIARGGPYDNGLSASTDLAYFSEWRLYRPNNLKPVIRFQIGDSIFWNAESSTLEETYAQMPRTKEALVGGGIASGLKMAAYISPSWVNQTRYYYLTGKNEIDAAVPLINNNKWEEATTIWAKYALYPSKTIRSKVQYNLALAAEMNGELNLAIEWGLKSFKSRYTKAIEVYLKTLDNKRKAQARENLKRY